MGAREGGSYLAGKSGDPKLQERTKAPELHVIKDPGPPVDVPTAPAPPVDPATREPAAPTPAKSSPKE
ncbi:hypothetical protein [Methylobacterium flocculans]|uniref:hypothetical protein n=1 Tax=Methylobacterium flocculans TaxID=2984843 RepID=UPI0021F283CD|nr:hypothetical protein [Methylobacterium sp. FF17]